MYQITLGNQGEVVIPETLRQALCLQRGDPLVIMRSGQRLIIATQVTAQQRLQARFSQIPNTINLADELIAERRQETLQETNSEQ